MSANGLSFDLVRFLLFFTGAHESRKLELLCQFVAFAPRVLRNSVRTARRCSPWRWAHTQISRDI